MTPTLTGEKTMKSINYTIEGVAGAGYRTKMIWDAGDNKWRERDGTDGTDCFNTREEAEAELQFALEDADIRDIEIVENVFEGDDE